MPSDKAKLLEKLMKEKKKQDVEAAVSQAEAGRISKMVKEAEAPSQEAAPESLSAGKAFVRQVVPESLRGEALTRYSKETEADIRNPEAQALGATLGDIYQALLPGPAGKLSRTEAQEASLLRQGYTVPRPAPITPPRGSESQIEGLGTPASRSLSRTHEGTFQVEALPPASRVSREPTPRYYALPVEQESGVAVKETSPEMEAVLKALQTPDEPLTSRVPARSLVEREGEAVARRQSSRDPLTGRRVMLEDVKVDFPGAAPAKESPEVLKIQEKLGEQLPWTPKKGLESSGWTMTKDGKTLDVLDIQDPRLRWEALRNVNKPLKEAEQGIGEGNFYLVRDPDTQELQVLRAGEGELGFASPKTLRESVKKEPQTEQEKRSANAEFVKALIKQAKQRK